MTRSGRRRLAGLATSLTMVAGGLLATAPSAAAGTGGGSSVRTGAYARAMKDGQSTVRFSGTVRVVDAAVSGSPVQATNRAIAEASCRRCRAVAVSVQIVVAGHVRDAGGSPAVRADNLAVAADRRLGVTRRTTRGAAGCSRCSSQAVAYQFVVVGRHRLAITPSARAEIASIQARMRSVTRSGLTPQARQARLDALARQIDAVLARGVVLSPY